MSAAAVRHTLALHEDRDKDIAWNAYAITSLWSLRCGHRHFVGLGRLDMGRAGAGCQCRRRSSALSAAGKERRVASWTIALAVTIAISFALAIAIGISIAVPVVPAVAASRRSTTGRACAAMVQGKPDDAGVL